MLVISSPPAVAGTYSIIERIDNNSIRISPPPATSFVNGAYDIYNISLGRSGFQNGFFTLEQAGSTNVPFVLPQGVYEFDYSVYLEIPFLPTVKLDGYVGSDITGLNQAKAIIDEFRILSKKLTDVRIGETLAENQDSITTDATALRPFDSNSNTLMLLHFDEHPIVNSANFWISAYKEYLQSGNSVNNNFGQSLLITNKPLVVENAGLLSTTSEGTIEFWVSPRYDTYNDPNLRFYFDAAGLVVEEAVSVTSGTVKVTGRISEVTGVYLVTDADNSGTNYYTGGSIASDFQTINLHQALPYQKTPVKIIYTPSGLSGDRLSIYKDQEGFITFNIRAKGIDYQVRQPIFWPRDTWHRIRVTFKLNRLDNKDEIRLFVDGEERGMILFGNGLLFGSGAIFGQGFAGVDDTFLISDINFTDSINQFYIGSDYLENNTSQARIDNLKISNTARKPITVAGQPKDINFSTNLDIVYPVVPDVFTTYLLDFDALLKKADDFTLLKSEMFGIFDFTLDIFDSFGVVSGNAKVKQVLENLIDALKPAPSRATLNYL
jgi:hypothetical protein